MREMVMMVVMTSQAEPIAWTIGDGGGTSMNGNQPIKMKRKNRNRLGSFNPSYQRLNLFSIMM